MSFGPISWLIVGEVFPLAVRGQAGALATVTNFGSNFLVCHLSPDLACNRHEETDAHKLPTDSGTARLACMLAYLSHHL